LVIVGFAGDIAALLIFGLGFGHLPVAVIFLALGAFLFFNLIGPGSQGMTMATLSYPTSIRGAGTGWAQAMNRVGTTIGFFFLALVREQVGLDTTLLLLTIVPVIGLNHDPLIGSASVLN
jgi:hypothetical protein